MGQHIKITRKKIGQTVMGIWPLIGDYFQLRNLCNEVFWATQKEYGWN